MANRHLFDRLQERTDAVVERLKPPRRHFVMFVRSRRNEDAQIAAFREQHGVRDNDMLVVVTFVRSPNSGKRASEPAQPQQPQIHLAAAPSVPQPSHVECRSCLYVRPSSTPFCPSCGYGRRQRAAP